MSRLEDRTINQILLQIIGPMLIACMVSSLVFFFIEVLYRGPHAARLYWVMGLFTIASVLVSRISIDEGRERAQLFGLALGLATFIAGIRLVEFSYAGLTVVGPVVVLVLILIVMWTSSQLTWDCTVVDRSRDASSIGLLEIFKRKISGETVDGTLAGEKSNKGGLASQIQSLLGGSRKNSPGIWVFYFAIVALPVFGLGQWLVQPSSGNWIYVLFAVYLGSTLGLLMTTSLLGLERHLSHRNLHVPAAVVRNWLMVGSLIALLVVLTVMLLPRPGGSGSMSNLVALLNSPNRNASKLAIGDDGQHHQDNARRKKRDVNGEKPDDRGEKGDPQQGEPKGNQAQAPPEDQQKNSGGSSHQQRQDDGKSKPGSGESKSENALGGEKAKTDSGSNENRKDSNTSRNSNAARKPNPGKARKDAPQPGDQSKTDKRQARPDQQPSATKSRQSGNLIEQLLKTASSGLRWLTWLIGAAAPLVLAWLFRNEIAKLFGGLGKRKSGNEAVMASVPVETERLAPFSSFQDPFTSGRANSMSPGQIANYTMAALEAWGREAGIHRNQETTPHEYAKQLAAIDSKLSGGAGELAELYGRCAFGGGTVGRVEMKPLVNLWRHMSQPMAKRQERQLSTAHQ